MAFPKGFFIGAATAAHQVEGNNIHSDYWAQEQLPHTSFAEPSGLACDHYNRYEEDTRLLAEAGLNAYRFSIEWARIEPEEGKFDEGEIEHYRKVIACCKEKGVEPIVTLLHFTSPLWLIRKGGWEAESTVEDFRRYATYVTEKLGSELNYICTINEANMGLQLAAISKRFRLMAQQAAQKAKSAEGTVQVGPSPRSSSLPAPQRETSSSSAPTRRRKRPSRPCTRTSGWASPSPCTICRRCPAASALRKRPGTRNSGTICPISRTTIFWACRTTPGPSTAPRGSCPAPRVRS